MRVAFVIHEHPLEANSRARNRNPQAARSALSKEDSGRHIGTLSDIAPHSGHMLAEISGKATCPLVGGVCDHHMSATGV
jgi:hypothetical protein